MHTKASQNATSEAETLLAEANGEEVEGKGKQRARRREKSEKSERGKGFCVLWNEAVCVREKDRACAQSKAYTNVAATEENAAECGEDEERERESGGRGCGCGRWKHVRQVEA